MTKVKSLKPKAKNIGIVLVLLTSMHILSGTLLDSGKAYFNGLSPLPAFAAADDPYLLKETAEHAGVKQPYTPSTLPLFIGKLIRTILAFIGVVFFVLVIYAGFKWMTARGKEEITGEAKTTLENALIGLIVISAAYAITTFIIERVWK